MGCSLGLLGGLSGVLQVVGIWCRTWGPKSSLVSDKVEVFIQSCRLGYKAQKRGSLIVFFNVIFESEFKLCNTSDGCISLVPFHYHLLKELGCLF